MVRYAGSRPGLQFEGFNPSGAGTGGAGAGAMASVGEINSQLRGAAPDFAGMGATAVNTDSQMNVAATNAEASVVANAIDAKSQVEAAEIKAKAMEDAASDAAGKSMMGGIIKTGFSLAGMAMMSDASTKNTVEKIEDALTTLRQLRPVSFYYNEEYSCNPQLLHHGFIAQEYQKVLPDATYYDESTQKLCIDTNDLIGLLVRAIQQLEVKVTRLEAKAVLTGDK